MITILALTDVPSWDFFIENIHFNEALPDEVPIPAALPLFALVDGERYVLKETGDRLALKGHPDGHDFEADDVVARFEGWGTQNYDEDVSQLDHALQTAALARAEGADDALVAAALLHDVGHLLQLRAGGVADGQTDADLRHEDRGARRLPPAIPAAAP